MITFEWDLVYLKWNHRLTRPFFWTSSKPSSSTMGCKAEEIEGVSMCLFIVDSACSVSLVLSSLESKALVSTEEKVLGLARIVE